MLIPLKLVRDQQLQQQLFDQLRDLIVSGRLLPGARMPSSRMMAEQFAISRMTVLLTYERLVAEGCLETRPANGTFVAHRRGFPRPGVAEPPSPYEFPGSAAAAPETSVGCSDPSLFPARRWRSLMRAGLDSLGTHMAPEHPAGFRALRDAIARWLSTSRGLSVTPDQVMLLKSRQQALHLAAHLASSMWRGGGARRVERIVVEDPCDGQAAATLAAERGELVRVAVDMDGLRTDRLPDGDAALIHVTPEHQRPLGVTLAHDRRLGLLNWAARTGALIVEEDCEGELRYGDMHIPSLMSLDTRESVVLIGGFCVSLGPWLDTAFIVLPRSLVAAAQTVRRLIDDSRSTLEQMALARFLEGGGYPRHLHRVTKAYASRRDVLVAALRRNFGGRLLIWGQQAGLHLAWFPAPEFGSAELIATLARRHGLNAASTGDGVVLLGFGMPDEQHIEAAVGHLAENLPAGEERIISAVPAMAIGPAELSRAVR